MERKKNNPLISQEINGLYQLKINGVISQEEFDVKKKDLLDNS
ncbi:MAG: SHOCT domain-containing protein [Candidatus Pristimantibacillus lignocellulolyticus]|uniref:SHOCT domain-containing protein n=1 Tax=Candidatus Pristimantibacillus lignocellulolyticus TaxID=2994561 RepID=A0A9J6ZAH9_9BACL|nr:MAG: SHOCT domain-containing protein [Candidatus Pristimantibacillus lignocellulolyticus]